ncbi:MAG: hypothetical protein ABFD96_25360 [Armatimonadia bacterium]
MRRFVQQHLVPAVLACIVFFTTLPFIESVLRLKSRAQAAIDWQGVEVITRSVKPGGVLEVVYTAQINKTCPSELRSVIVAPDGSVPVRFPTVAGGYTRPSPQPVEIRVRLPVPPQSDPGLAPLQSGQHIYRTTAIRYCPEGVAEDLDIPDAPFWLQVE